MNWALRGSAQGKEECAEFRGWAKEGWFTGWVVGSEKTQLSPDAPFSYAGLRWVAVLVSLPGTEWEVWLGTGAGM